MRLLSPYFLLMRNFTRTFGNLITLTKYIEIFKKKKLVIKLAKKVHAVYITERFKTLYTTARYWTLCWARLIHFMIISWVFKLKF